MGEGKRSKKKCLAYVAVFLVFQIAVISIFALTVMRLKSPKVRFTAISVESFASNNATSTSISMKLRAQLAIKNANFGHFKYDEATLVVLYDGLQLGEAPIPSGRAKAKKTQKFEVSVDVSTSRVSDSKLRSDINAGALRMSSAVKLNGKVHLLKVMKKNKSGEMKCDWDVNLGTKQVEKLNCD